MFTLIGLSMLGLSAYAFWREQQPDDPDPGALPHRPVDDACYWLPPDDALPDGWPEPPTLRLLPTAGGYCALWQDFWQETVVAVALTTDGQVRWQHADLGWASASSPDGRQLISADPTGQLRRLDASSGALLQVAAAPAAVYDLWWLTERLLVLGTDEGETLWLLDADTLQPLTPEPFRANDLRDYLQHTGYAPVVDPGPYCDPTYAPSTLPTPDPTAYVRSYFKSVQLHPTEPARLVVLDTSFDHLLHLRLAPFEPVALYPCAPDTAVAHPSADGRLLVQSTLRHEVVLTDVVTGQCLRTLPYPGLTGIQDPAAPESRLVRTPRCALSPDQQRVAVLDGSGQLWVLDATDAAPARPVPRSVLPFAHDVRWRDEHTLVALLDGFRLVAVDARTGQAG